MLSQTPANFSMLSNDIWFLLSGLNPVLGLFICFDSFMFSSCGAFLLPTVSFSSKRLDTSRRNTSSQLEDHCQLHPLLSFRLFWKPMCGPVLSICTCVHVHASTRVYWQMQESSWIFSSGEGNIWCSSPSCPQFISQHGKLVALFWGRTTITWDFLASIEEWYPFLGVQHLIRGPAVLQCQWHSDLSVHPRPSRVINILYEKNIRKWKEGQNNRK